MSKYRQVGGCLGAYIRANNPSTQQIQGLLADLLAGDELLPTMREVVNLPSFHALQEMAESGSGAVQRDALLQELANRYLPAVAKQVGQLLDGLLDINSATNRSLAQDIRFEEIERGHTDSSNSGSSRKSKSSKRKFRLLPGISFEIDSETLSFWGRKRSDLTKPSSRYAGPPRDAACSPKVLFGKTKEGKSFRRKASVGVAVSLVAITSAIYYFDNGMLFGDTADKVIASLCKKPESIRSVIKKREQQIKELVLDIEYPPVWLTPGEPLVDQKVDPLGFALKKILAGEKDSCGPLREAISNARERMRVSDTLIDHMVERAIQSRTQDQVDPGIRGLNTPYTHTLPMLCAYRNKGMENWQSTGPDGTKPRAITAWTPTYGGSWNRHEKIFLSRTNYLLNPKSSDGWKWDTGQNGFELSRGNLVIGCMNKSSISNGYKSFGFPSTRGAKSP